jgi:hypothetical protein
VTFLNKYRKLLDIQTQNHPVWKHNPKLAGRAVAVSLGVPVPFLFGVAPVPAAVWDHVRRGHVKHEVVVIKPNEGSTSRAVLPLTRKLYGLKQDLQQDEDEWTMWLEEQAMAKNQRVMGPWLVEEGILHPDGDRHADDLRVYCFAGRPMFVQRDANDPARPTDRKSITWAFWDSAGNRLGSDRIAMVSRAEAPANAPAPRDIARICAWAEEIAACVDTCFLRVDFLEGSDRVVFGELTPHPGPLTNQRVHIDPEFDALLGSLLPDL